MAKVRLTAELGRCAEDWTAFAPVAHASASAKGWGTSAFGYGPQTQNWSAAPESLTLKDGPCIAACHLRPNVAGNRLARQGQSELTGVLGGPIRSEKE